MKRISVIVNILLVVGIGVWLAIGYIIQGIDRGVCRMHAAELSSITHVLETYHGDTGTYPIGMTIQSLQSAVQPKYVKLMPTTRILYYSDGTHYDLLFHDRLEGEYQECGPCQLHIKDGAWVSWPQGLLPADWLKKKAS